MTGFQLVSFLSLSLPLRVQFLKARNIKLRLAGTDEAQVARIEAAYDSIMMRSLMLRSKVRRISLHRSLRPASHKRFVHTDFFSQSSLPSATRHRLCPTSSRHHRRHQ